MIRIVLADDHDIVRKGIRILLEHEPDFLIVAEASDGVGAVKLVESLHPDVLVTDLKMADLNGIEVARLVKEHSPETRVVVLSMYGDNAYVEGALAAGANGYVLKESSVEDLVRAIRDAVSGGRYLSPSLHS